MAAGDSVRAFYTAREFLFAHRDDYDTAYRDFRWPELDTFNWALDHVDAVAADPVRGARRALWIVEQDGSEAYWTFAELAARSNRVANRLARVGRAARRPGRAHARQPGRAVGDPAGGHEARRGDHPRDHPAAGRGRGGPAGPRRRPARRRRRVGDRGVRATCPATTPASRWAARRRAGWTTARRTAPRPTSRRTASPGPTTRCCSTSPRAPPRGPSSSSTPTPPIPSGTCRRCTGSGCEPGDVHLNISSPGWAKHAWSNVFAPWNAEACVLVMNYARFDAAGAARRARPLRGHQLLRAADGVADADPGRPHRPAPPAGARSSGPASRSTPR